MKHPISQELPFITARQRTPKPLFSDSVQNQEIWKLSLKTLARATVISYTHVPYLLMSSLSFHSLIDGLSSSLPCKQLQSPCLFLTSSCLVSRVIILAKCNSLYTLHLHVADHVLNSYITRDLHLHP